MKSPQMVPKSSRSDYPSTKQIKWFRNRLSAWGVVNRRDYLWRMENRGGR